MNDWTKGESNGTGTGVIIAASVLIAGCSPAVSVGTSPSTPLAVHRISTGILFPTFTGPGSQVLLPSGRGIALCVAPERRPVANGIQILTGEHDGSALPALTLELEPEWRIRACASAPPPSGSTQHALAVLGEVVSHWTDRSGGLQEVVLKQALFIVDVDKRTVESRAEWSGSELSATALLVQDGAPHEISLLGRGTVGGSAAQPCIERRTLPRLVHVDRRLVSDELVLDSMPLPHHDRRDPPDARVLVQSRRGLALLDTQTLAVEEIDAKGLGASPCSVDDHFDWDGDGIDDLLVLRRSTSSFEPLSSPSARLLIVSGKSLEVVAEIGKGAQSGIGTVLGGVPLVVFTTNAGIWTVIPSGAEVLHPGTGQAHTIPFVYSHRASRSPDESIHLGVDRWKDVPPGSETATDSVEIWRITRSP